MVTSSPAITVYQQGQYALSSGVSLFGISIVRSISHFFGQPKTIWLTKYNFGIPKRNLVDQKNEKLTGQLVYQRD